MAWRLAVLFAAALMLTAVDSAAAKAEKPAGKAERPGKREKAEKPVTIAGAAGSRLHEDGDVLVWWQDASLAVPRYVKDSQGGVHKAEPLRISAARNEHEPF